MDKKLPLTGIELLLVACKPNTYENFKDITKQKVIDICLDKGYLTKKDTRIKNAEYQFVMKVFERDYPAMILIAPKIEPVLKPEDYQRVQQQSEEFAEAIIENISKALMDRQIPLPV